MSTLGAQVSATFHGLRQQAEKEDNKEPYLCLSDFVAPKARTAPAPEVSIPGIEIIYTTLLPLGVQVTLF